MFLRLWLVLSLACSDGPATIDAHDTNRDEDANREDVVQDVMQDSAEPDSTDAPDSRDSMDPSWQRLPGMPDKCAVEHSVDPSGLLAVEWVDCGEGCSYLSTSDRRFSWTAQAATGQSDGVGFFALRGEDDEDRRIMLLADSNGRVHGAWRQPVFDPAQVCNVAAPNVGGGMVGFAIRVFIDGVNREERIYHAPLDELTTPISPIAVLTPATGFPVGTVAQPLLASATTVAARVPPQHVYLFQDGEIDILGGQPPIEDSPQELNLVGDHALWSEWRANVRVAHGRIGQPADVYYEVAGTRVFGFSTDGRDTAWLQCQWDGVRCSDVELWTAPYADEPTAFRPRRVRDYPSGGQSYTAGGMYLHQEVRSIQAFRLNDGAQLEFRLPVGVVYVNAPVFQLEDEIAFATRVDGIGTVLRIRYAMFAEPGS